MRAPSTGKKVNKNINHHGTGLSRKKQQHIILRNLIEFSKGKTKQKQVITQEFKCSFTQ